MKRSEFLRRLALLAGTAAAGCSTQPAQRVFPEFRVLTSNIHHGEGRDGRLDLFRIAQVINESNSDLVALQEVDRGVARTQRRDLPAELGALTRLTPIFANNHPFEGGEYGNAILSRFPVKRWENHHYRPVRPGEQRGLLQAVVEVGAKEVAFLNTHLDHRSDDEERLASVDEIEAVAARYGEAPIVLCGDFNALPGSRVHTRLIEQFRDVWRLVGHGAGATYPSEQPTRRIDYLWLKGPVNAVSAEVITGDGSDHAAVRATLQLTG